MGVILRRVGVVAFVPAFLNGGQGGRGRVETGGRAVNVMVLVGNHGLAVVSRLRVVVHIVRWRWGPGGVGRNGVGRGGRRRRRRGCGRGVVGSNVGDRVTRSLRVAKVVVWAGCIRMGRRMRERRGMDVCKARALGLLLVGRCPAAVRVLVVAHGQILRVRLFGRGRRPARAAVAEVCRGRQCGLGQRRRGIRRSGVVGVQSGLFQCRGRRQRRRRIGHTHGGRRRTAFSTAHGT